MSSLVKLRFPVLLLHSPCIIFAADKIKGVSRNLVGINFY